MKEKHEFEFPKSNKLTQHHLIQRLFAHKHPFLSAFPVKMVFFFTDISESGSPLQFLITVPKRQFPKAVSRNYVKRIMRESIRLNLNILNKKLETMSGKSLVIMIIYQGKTLPDFHQIHTNIQSLFTKFEIPRQLSE